MRLQEVLTLKILNLAMPQNGSSKKPSFWLATASSIAFVTIGIFGSSLLPQSPVQAQEKVFRLDLPSPSQLPLDPSMLKPWGVSPMQLPHELPNFTQGTGTLGISKEDPYTPWRLATVIVRTDDGWGSGAIISADGWILTNYHVVETVAQKAAITGEVATVKIILAQIVDGRIKPNSPLKAKLYRADPGHDLALLKLQTLPQGEKDLPYFITGH